MSKEKRLSDFICVRGRFHRSVHLVRDAASSSSRDGYILTSTARALGQRIIEGLQSDAGPKAWSLTGPYGSGKSSFALFLSDVLRLNCPKGSVALRFREELRLKKMAPFANALVVGRRTSLCSTLLAALFDVLDGDALRDSCEEIRLEVQAVLQAETVDAEAVLVLYERAIDAVQEAGYGGLSLIIDEFGKFLEFAALHPNEEDLFVMQSLAELAARSSVPFLLVTILHSAFTDYLPSADRTRKAEWAKVQGRFQDAAFLEPPEQVLALIGSAIERKLDPSVEKALVQQGRKALKGKDFGEVRRKFDLGTTLDDCLPLHPTTALMLWPVFRSELSQNERSLFSFLTSEEPYGFSAYLNETDCGKHLETFTLDRLYDYISSSLGAAVYRGATARRWSEVAYALERVGADAPALTLPVLKAVGLLMLHGTAVGLRASQEVLQACFADEGQVAEAIQYLVQRSILVHRRHQNAYALWEGSDVDLEALFQKALSRIQGASLASLVSEGMELRPFIARAHYFKTGTMRAFDVEVVSGDEETLSQTWERAKQSTCDGKIIFVLTRVGENREKLIKLAKSLNHGDSDSECPVIWAFPEPVSGLENALLEVQAWRWTAKNAPELASDKVARTEVVSRLAYALDRLGEVAGETFGLRGFVFRPDLSSWVYNEEDKTQAVQTQRDFLHWLSVICDYVYGDAPHLANELLNRDRLSSSAAAARNNLLRLIVNNEHEEQLGIEGFPAELSMYASLLERAGFHRQKPDGAYEFADPSALQWESAWNHFLRELGKNRMTRRNLAEVFEAMKRAPYGLRDGVMPILLVLALKIHPSRFALYYADGMLIPELRDEVVERLARNPDQFEVQEYAMTKDERTTISVLGQALEAMGMVEEGGDHELLSIVRPLVSKVARLPRYTKNTRQLTEQSIAIREVLLKAADPHQLVFDEIPAAFAGAEDLGEAVAASIKELVNAYPELLHRLEQQLKTAFALDENSDLAWKQLQDRAQKVIDFAGEQKLQLFVREASKLEGRDWREVLGRVVQRGVPPDRWTDRDAVEFQMNLQLLKRDFIRLEEVLLAKGEETEGSLITVGFFGQGFVDRHEYIRVPRGYEQQVGTLQEELSKSLNACHLSGEQAKAVRLAALAQLLQAEMSQGGGDRE